MNIDLELMLVIGVLLTGGVWALDTWLWAPARRRQVMLDASAAGGSQGAAVGEAEGYKEPWYVEYSKSFFPVLLIVLLLRSFVVEPFRIPSGSMMPTLLVGDFILVNKFAYGLRLPVLHTKVVEIGEPKRGDVVVFRFPRNPAEDYIKRVVGLPGDRIAYYDKVVYVNGKPMNQSPLGTYHGVGSGSVMDGAGAREEQLEDVRHQILVRPDRLNVEGEYVVPPGHYFVMGDNRDNSNDSRFWGFVPEENLVGRAFLIWLNWDIKGGVFDPARIGDRIN
jgi:signal peptidase I